MNYRKNKILSLFIVSISLLAITGCSDWLNLEPENDLIKKEYWKSEDDVRATLTGSYNALTNCVQQSMEWGELRADMVQMTLKTSSSYQQIMTNIITDNSDVARWSDFYKVINYANNVIKFTPEVLNNDPSFTEAKSNQLLSEAYFLRSLSYFYLVRAFKEVPLVLEPSDSDGEDYDVPKTAEMDILNRIVEDLKTYEPFAATSFTLPAQTKGKATKGAINALLCDIYLWRAAVKKGNGESAEADLQACIKASEKVRTMDYRLLAGESWFQNFYPGNSSESIFELQFDKENGQTNDLLKTFSSELDYQLVAPSSISALYDGNQNDTRANGYSFFTQENGENEIWKYVGAGFSSDGKENRRAKDARDNHWIFYRLPDVMLLEAEARLLLDSNDPEATNILKQIKERSSIAPAEWSASLSEILAERSRELAFEGKRWFDLLRFARRGEEGKRMIMDILLASVSASDRPFFEIKFKDINSYYYPIHIDEMKENQKLEQNPFYKY